MAVCPNGHDSASDDFCDVCGMRIDGARMSPPAGSAPAPGPAPWPDPTAPAAAGAEPCPRCGTPRTGQFCEACGFNFSGPRFTPAGPPPSAPASYSQATPGPDGYSQASSDRGGFSQASSDPGGYSQPASDPGGYSQPASGPGGYRQADPGSAATGYSSAQPPPASPFPSAPLVPPSPTAAPVSTPGEPAPASPSISSFPYPQATWTAVVGADRAYYERVQAATGPEGAAVTFPAYCAERRFQLVGNQMRIGRRSVSRGLSPEIDLTGPPADPGISRLHAVLIAMPDGNWAVLDPGSANGTLVNGSEIGVGDQVPLHDGDRINLGAWTAITVHRGLENSPPGVGHWRATTDDARH
jgi:FHA domain